MIVSEETETTSYETADSTRARRPMHRTAGLLGALALSWIVPAVAYFAHVAAVVPFVFLVLVASLIRSGHSVLDRMMFAVALTFGALCPAALLFSVWPWGLHPVPIAGVGFTIVVLCAAATGRRPAVPGLGRLSDLFTVVIGAFTAALILWPLLGRGFAGRLANIVMAEDLARHYAIYEGIRSSGGFNFLHRSESARFITPDLVSYPQGSHLALGVFDNFLRSATDMGAAQGSLDRFVFYYAGMYIFMIFAILWAIRWVAGPKITPWRYFAVAGSTTAYLFFSDGTSMFLHGFLSEFAGLAIVAVLVAVLIRPMARQREQLLMLAVLTTALGYIYYLFLPVAGLMVLVWVFTNRKALRADLWWSLGATVSTALLAAVVPLVNWSIASNAEAINAPGGINPVNRHLLVLLMFVLGLSLAGRANWLNPVKRMALLWLIACGGAAMLMFAYQTAVVGETSYYYEKLLHQLIVVGLVCLGATSLTVAEPSPDGARVPFGRPIPALVLTGCLVLAFVYNSGPDREAARGTTGDRAWGTAYFIGQTDQPTYAHLVTDTLKALPDPGNSNNFLQVTGDRMGNYYGTLWIDVLSRNLGTAWRVSPSNQGILSRENLTERLTEKYADRKVRVLTDNPATYDAVQRIRLEYPKLGLELMFSNPNRCTDLFKAVPAPVALAAPMVPEKVPYPQNGCKRPGKRG